MLFFLVHYGYAPAYTHLLSASEVEVRPETAVVVALCQGLCKGSASLQAKVAPSQRAFHFGRHKGKRARGR